MQQLTNVTSRDVLFINRLEDVKPSYHKLNGTAGFPLVTVHRQVLPHNVLSAVLVGGIGPDPLAPLCADMYKNSDFLGFHYGNSRFPLTYGRDDYLSKLKESELYAKLLADFSDVYDIRNGKDLVTLLLYIFIRNPNDDNESAR